jgi:hypothetical protein
MATTIGRGCRGRCNIGFPCAFQSCLVNRNHSETGSSSHPGDWRVLVDKAVAEMETTHVPEFSTAVFDIGPAIYKIDFCYVG